MNQDFHYPNSKVNGYQVNKDIKIGNRESYEIEFTKKEDIYKKTLQICEDIFNILGGKEILHIRRKKIIMSVVVELLENMVKHGDVSETHHAKFKFSETQNDLLFETENYTETKNIADLEKKIVITKENDLQQIKHSFKHQLTNGNISEKGGAGCGVFTIVKGIKKLYPELDTTDIYQQKSEGLNGIREVHIKVKMPNKDPDPIEHANKANITKENYED